MKNHLSVFNKNQNIQQRAKICIISALFSSLTFASPKTETIKKEQKIATRGMLTTDPKWSAGIQIGNYGATGVNAQKAGFYNGAINVGIGLAEGGIVVYGDYILFLNEDLKLEKISTTKAYKAMRGHISPYFGGGLQAGKGLQLEAPLGVQYTMLKDSMNFYGGATMLYGPFFTDSNLGLKLWFQIGARLLL